ncbi:MAG: hypothetical protein COB83_08765 [Gammaproteobacteria bacterium]|nr:MAG: hypothetical protein COB83_08765 [Gammaproteobacteria bacterium]
MNKKFFFSLLATSMLTACGGSSSDKPESPVLDEANKAPIAVADEGLVQNNEVLTLNVLANDTDADNDSLSISEITVQPENGTVEISNNTLVYTPGVNFAGVDTLSYRVSDGKLTSDASVALTINHTMTLSGKVTDSPIANALVRVEVGGEIFEVIADAEGNYQLPIVINDMAAILEIRATGSADNEQDNVELVVISGGVEQLLEQVDDNRILSEATNATHVSTATYLLVKDRNNGENINSVEQLEQLSSEVSAEELIGTASFIKLLIDNDDFAIPEGQTTVSALESITGGEEGVEVSTADAIQGYLVDNNLVDENGEPTQAFDDAIAAATEETLADPDVFTQFTTDMFSGKKIIELQGAKSGWHEYQGSGWVFNADGTTNNYVAGGSGRAEVFSQGTWSVVGGKVEIVFSEQPPLSFVWVQYPFDDVVDNYGFDISVKTALMAAVDAGVLNNVFQVEMAQGYASKTLTLLNKTDSVYQVNISGDFVYTIVIPDGVTWQGENPQATNQKSFSAIYAYGYPSLFTGKTMEELAGDWIFYLDYQLKSFWDDLQLLNGFSGDKFTLTATTANGTQSGMNFSADLDENGVLVLTSGDIVYKIKPIVQAGKGYLAATEKWVAGELQYIVANSIAKFDDSHASFTDNLVTEFPEVYLSYINGSKAESWQGDKLKLDAVWGYKFNADGSLNRGINGQNKGENNWDGIVADHFNLGDDRWTWDKADNMVSMSLEQSWRIRNRAWEVISVDEQGRALVFEYSTWGTDVNGDGVITDGEFGSFINPRINIQKKEDLSRWTEAWQNTVNAGLVADEAKASYKPIMNKRKGKTVAN